MNTIWLLEPRAVLAHDPWDKSYKLCVRITVCAETQEDARELAATRAGDEGRAAWLNPAVSRCRQMRSSYYAAGVLTSAYRKT